MSEIYTVSLQEETLDLQPFDCDIPTRKMEVFRGRKPLEGQHKPSVCPCNHDFPHMPSVGAPARGKLGDFVSDYDSVARTMPGGRHVRGSPLLDDGTGDSDCNLYRSLRVGTESPRRPSASQYRRMRPSKGPRRRPSGDHSIFGMAAAGEMYPRNVGPSHVDLDGRDLMRISVVGCGYAREGPLAVDGGDDGDDEDGVALAVCTDDSSCFLSGSAFVGTTGFDYDFFSDRAWPASCCGFAPSCTS